MNKFTLKSFFLLLILHFSCSASGLSHKHKSAPGCPSETEDEVWLWDEENNGCHRVNTQGPCSPGMVFYPHPSRDDKIHGFCDCFDARMFTEEEQRLIDDKDLSHCIKDVRSQIYVPERNRCYSAFDQGPCPEGRWLVLNDSLYPVCAKHQCPSDVADPMSTKFLFSHSAKDKCYVTMTRGYCPKNYKLRYSGNDWYPRCKYSPSTTPKKKCPTSKSPISRIITRSRCKPGSRRDFISHCSQSVNPR